MTQQLEPTIRAGASFSIPGNAEAVKAAIGKGWLDNSNETVMQAAQRGYEEWAAKPHNKKWVKRIEGTPIPNDLLVCIADAILHRSSQRSRTPDKVSRAMARFAGYFQASIRW